MKPTPAFVDQRPWLSRLYTPEWAGGWLAVRWLWVLAALMEHAWRVRSIEEAFVAPDMVFTSGIWRMAEYIELDATGGYALWGGTMLGIAMVAWGGRLLKPGIVIFLLCGWTLGAYEALNVKAHDRLLWWVSLGLFFSPADQSGLTGKYRSPFARLFLCVVFSGIYGTTGFAKALYEDSWFTGGTVLGLHLLDQNHGGGTLAVWLSDKWWFTLPGALVTVLWELTFPLAIWIRKLNPWYLLIGMVFHLTLLATMQLGPFAFVALAAYPVLLDPEVARSLHGRLRPSAMRDRS